MEPAATNDQTDLRALGRALRRLRDRACLSQTELAVKAGTDHTYVSRVEHGRIDLRWRTLARLLDAMEATVSDLGAEMDGRDHRSN